MQPTTLLAVLTEDEEIHDLVALKEGSLPQWIQRLGVPPGWQPQDLPDNAESPMARLTVHGSLGDGRWEAAETMNVFGYTGWPVFYDVYHHADGILRNLHAGGVVLKVLPVPRVERVAAVRSSGIAAIGGRNVWVQHSTYVVGSKRPHESRLIVQNIFVDGESRSRLAGDVAWLSGAVYDGFVAAVFDKERTA
ncbi:hypothetical protein A5657_09370 [Mycobacterium kubicae]|nr:hypothetical protein A5657_09370 [Mycobacterium kubicae]